MRTISCATPDVTSTPETDEHTFLVAFTVEGTSREAAEYALHGRLIPTLQSQDETSPVIEWWVAEDDRRDGSDCDSATFVPFTPADDDDETDWSDMVTVTIDPATRTDFAPFLHRSDAVRPLAPAVVARVRAGLARFALVGR